MISTPPTVDLGQLQAADGWGRTVVWCGRSVRDRVAGTLPHDIVEPSAPPEDDVDTLIAVGGGALIDRAKLATRTGRRRRLVAVPSIWGSGADASPVVVFTEQGRKQFLVAPEYLPDFRCEWPELLDTVSDEAARQACGDVWSHALEGFLSPLATDELRTDLAVVIRRMLDVPLRFDERRLELSALACAGQARSSVGVVHGIAHVLEPALNSFAGVSSWGHARLCSAVLYPVMTFNSTRFAAWQSVCTRFDVGADKILETIRSFGSPHDFAAILPTIGELWKTILRDPCTRTNCTLIRPGDLPYFAKFDYA